MEEEGTGTCPSRARKSGSPASSSTSLCQHVASGSWMMTGTQGRTREREGAGGETLSQEGAEDYLAVGIPSHLSLGLVLAKTTSFSNRQKETAVSPLTRVKRRVDTLRSRLDGLAGFLRALSAECIFNHNVLPLIS